MAHEQDCLVSVSGEEYRHVRAKLLALESELAETKAKAETKDKALQKVVSAYQNGAGFALVQACQSAEPLYPELKRATWCTFP